MQFFLEKCQILWVRFEITPYFLWKSSFNFCTYKLGCRGSFLVLQMYVLYNNLDYTIKFSVLCSHFYSLFEYRYCMSCGIFYLWCSTGTPEVLLHMHSTSIIMQQFNRRVCRRMQCLQSGKWKNVNKNAFLALMVDHLLCICTFRANS